MEKEGRDWLALLQHLHGLIQESHRTKEIEVIN
jgi:hypothetical protein